MKLGYVSSILVASTLLAPPVAATPAAIRTVDPLKSPPPPLEKELVLPEDTRPAAARVAPILEARFQAGLSTESELRLIVTLQQPLDLKLEVGPTAQRAAMVANLEHRFMGALTAEGITLREARGLSHFPIVIGKAASGDVHRIAGLAEVFAVEEVQRVVATRTQGAALMNADDLRTQLGGNGAGIGVAVIDSGVDVTHPELDSQVVAHADLTGTTGDGRIDGTGHGTSVAGIIAGTTAGLAREASIWALKVFDNVGNGTNDAVAAALDLAFANLDNFGGLNIVNMSIGTPTFHTDSAAVCAANFVSAEMILDNLRAAGVAVFAASGNAGQLDGVEEPACHEATIAVGAVYDANVGPRGPFPGAGNCFDNATAADQITCYSNSGELLDILAPADCSNTPTSFLNDPSGTNTCFNGTSAASPYAAGVAAQILSLLPETSPGNLRSALRDSGKPLTDVNGITRNRIDAVQAYQALVAQQGGCNPDAFTACLLGDRFRVTGVMTNGAGQDFPMKVMTFGGQRAESDSTVFFESFIPGGVEYVFKMLDACNSPFESFWGFLSGTLTNQETAFLVEDTVSGQVRTYANAPGQVATGFQSTSYFTTCN